MRKTVETTYADLRPTDLVIDKSGKAWPIDLEASDLKPVQFWLLDPASKVKMHHVVKSDADPVTVSRIPTQADEAAKLEADFPPESMRHAADMPEVDLSDDAPSFTEQLAALKATGNYPSMAEAVAAVEEIGGEVEAEVTAEEVDAANAATDDEPVNLPPFTDMDILQMRSHLYLLHGVMAHDVQSRDMISKWHTELHSPENKVKSKTIPHVHA